MKDERKAVKFYGVGVGPGDPGLLTLKAIEVLQRVDVIAIPKSRLDRESVAWQIAGKHCRPGAVCLEIELPMTLEQHVVKQAWRSGSEAILKEIRNGKTVAFVTLGDASLYSTYSYLLTGIREELAEEEIETVPGITAMSAAAARLNIPLATGDEPLIVLPSAERVNDYLAYPNLVLLKVSRRLPELAVELKKARREAFLLTRVGQKEEKISKLSDKAAETEDKIDYLSLILVKQEHVEG